MVSKSDRRSSCPISSTLDAVGDKWTLLIIRDLLRGASQYDEFRSSPERIASNVLSQRLKNLIELGLIERHQDEYDKRRFNYELTAEGKTLIPIVELISDWGLDHLDGVKTLPLIS